VGVWVLNATAVSVVTLTQIFDEILVNAADNRQRDPNMSMLKIEINSEKNRYATPTQATFLCCTTAIKFNCA
jgi:hypothetical protein